ncbi:MAG: restriction endonuclease subunit S [Vicinamibacterales bacterium]
MSTDLGPLPAQWSSAALGEVCEKIQDGTHLSPKTQLAGGQYRYVTAKNVRSTGLDLGGVTYLRPEDHRSIFRRCDPRKGDVLLVKDGVNTGDVALNTLDEEISLLSSVCFLRPEVGVLSPPFLRYFLMSPVGQQALTGRMTGTAIRRIVLHRIKETRIRIAPPAEQGRIVEVLDSYLSQLDAAVASLASALRKLKTYRASVLKAAVEGRLVPTEAELARKEGRSYEPADVLLARILKERRRRWEEVELAKMKAAGRAPKDDRWKQKYLEPEPPDVDTLPGLPEGWRWATLDWLAEIRGGITKGQKRRPGEELCTVPYLRVANVQRGYLDLAHVKTIDATPSEVEELRLQRGDVLFNEGGDRDKLGRGWVWNDEIPDCIHQNHVFRARLTSPLRPRFVSWYANSKGQAYFFDQGTQTTNLASVNMTKLRALPVPIPPLIEQDRILDEVERLLSVTDATLDCVADEARRCQRLRQSVLAWAFEGKLVDQDPRDEPAAALLARIRAERAAAAVAQPKAKRPKKLRAAS